MKRKFDVKQKLNELDIKIGEFAEELKITRPTLNSYINDYEKGEELSNSRYQIIFDKLFKGDVESKEEFKKITKRFHNLLERDGTLGLLDIDAKKTDLVMGIFEQIKVDMAKDDAEEDIYIFVNMILRSYRREKIFKELGRYFLFLNGIKDKSEIQDEEKPFLSKCFELMSAEKCGKLEFNDDCFQKFSDRIDEISSERISLAEEESKKIMLKKFDSKIKMKVEELSKLGLEVEDMDFEEIIGSIDFEKDN